MATEFWYNDGTAWRKVKEFWYNDGTWRNIKEAWYNDGTAWRKFFTVGGVSLASLPATVEEYAIGSSASAGLVFYTDGTVQDSNNIVYNWYAPTTNNIGASYWIKITKLGGADLDVNGAPGWSPLTSLRNVWISVGIAGPGLKTKSSSIRVEIASDAAGTTIVASKDIDLTATAEL